ncbi:BZ3500_MvSof-1268-A1-R1_Chr2-1g04618 [Microbotryum saponariae]|uniref:BZ3500_MvSof-1268-A1-R1_Chr2-1g04618 protein n=1 Tax=Microbotryum saponariae TaxID=289078 RepID=A0A2X0KBF6_9BASI|nr:BZ3500_MvSof-1268-A1-R1_Chr2-1g04618 [Microbotryum saponariae]SCZ92138.1 BZ3501_MvSof-1269-A2-R1_Chr2-1g04274 [Microbotryum saponariae]
MPPARKATSEPTNSASCPHITDFDHEHETEDDDHRGDGSKGKGKKSTKSKESAQRKQQNRLAQREFRQRKQAYVKELEVRVNLLARSKDDQLEGMKLTIRTLLDENQELREVLGHLGRFIGSGLGGCLPEIGLSPEELKRLAARGRLDAVHKIIEQMDRKDSKEQDPWARKRSSSQNGRAESSNPNAASGTSGQTVATTSGSGDATESNKATGKKRARTLDSTSSLSAQPGGPDAMNDMNGYFSIDPTFMAPWSQGLQDEPNGSLEGVSLLSSNDQRITPRQVVRERRLLEGYPAATATTTSTTSAFGNGGMSNKNTTDLGASSSSVTGTSSISPDPPYHHNTHESTSTLEDVRSEMRQQHEEANAVIRDLIISFNLSSEFWTSTDEDGAKMFVQFHASPLHKAPAHHVKLTMVRSSASDHVRNKLENPSYHLPPALRATEIQQSIPHPPWVDGIIFSSLRDRVILLPKGRCDLPVLWNDIMDHVECHENSDCLSPANWEISEHFMKKYWYLIDENVLTISNRWRMERGERMLEMKDLVPV